MTSSPTSSSEDGNIPGGSKEPSTEEVADVSDRRIEGGLDKWKELDHSDKDAVESFRAHYGHDMSSPRAKVLSRLANREDWPTEKIESLLRDVIGDYKSLLVDNDPINTALKNRNHSFIQAVLDTADPVALAEVLSQGAERGATALHEAINSRSPLTNQMILAWAVIPSILRRSSSGYTLLHLAVSLAQVDDRGKSGNRARHGAHQPQSQSSMTKERQDTFHFTMPDTYSYNTVRQLVRVDPDALILRDADGNTPYQLRLGKLGERLTRRRDLIASYILQYCVRNMSPGKAMAALYRSGEELELSLDLTGAKLLSRQDLQSLAGHSISFEHTLAYVALPNIRLHGSVGDGEGQVKRHYRTDYCIVFGWLREQGVKKIMSVTVNDGEEPSHSDEAIENAMAGFEVERWDWQRPDISSRVIASSTSVVREVHVYFSGKSAILDEWCGDAGGFGDRAKFPELRLLKIHLKDESSTIQDVVAVRARAYEAALNETRRPKTRNDGRVLAVETLSDGHRDASMSEIRLGPIHRENPWIAKAEAFASVLTGLSTPETQAIQIAVIDDGFDISESLYSSKVSRGVSYLPTEFAESGISASWFIPVSGHGTIMAALICSICPMARLYLAKIPVGPSVANSNHRDSTEAAAKAVRWALACDVDIICMAWSVTRDNEDLKDAVHLARARGVPIICATPDGGPASGRAYPSNYEACISIGSADNFGMPASFESEFPPDFLFPGLEIPVALNNGIKIHSGSSVATAMACGFAGLLLSSKRLLDPDDRKGFVNFRSGLSGTFRFIQQKFRHGDSRYIDISAVLGYLKGRGETQSEVRKRLEEMFLWISSAWE